MNNRLRKLVLLQGDIILLYFSLFLTLTIRYQELPSLDNWKIHVYHFSLIFVVWLVIFYISGLYNLHTAVNNGKFTAMAFRALAVAAFTAVAYFYANQKIEIAPKTNLLVFILVFSFFFFWWRRLYNYSLNAYLPKNNIAFVGYNQKTKELIDYLDKHPHLGFKPVLVVDNPELVESRVKTVEFLNDIKPEFKKHHIRYAVLASDTQNSGGLRAALFSSLSLGINFISLPNFYEKITGKVPLDEINQTWFLENLNEGERQGYAFVKRILDFFVAGMILVLSAPLWPLIALVIKLESRGPVFIKMERVGKNNLNFKMLKFRTMREDNNQRTPTVKNDPRITRFGGFMRKTRLDEIPQVINIIIGDMSLVGPRPELPRIVEKLTKEIPFYNERTLVKPGVTGWDQVSGEYHSPSVEDSLKKMQYDLYYIKNRSHYLDFTIILKTIGTVLSGKGL